MHVRLEEVQFSGLSAPPKPDCHQPGQMLFPSLQGEGLGEGFVASCQLEKKIIIQSLDCSPSWVSRAVLTDKARPYSQGIFPIPVHIPAPPYL